jgi:hypothetical protein
MLKPSRFWLRCTRMDNNQKSLQVYIIRNLRLWIKGENTTRPKSTESKVIENILSYVYGSMTNNKRVLVWIYWLLLLQSPVITINYKNSQSIFSQTLLPWLLRTRSVPFLVLSPSDLIRFCTANTKTHPLPGNGYIQTTLKTSLPLLLYLQHVAWQWKLFDCCLHIRCCGNLFTESLPRNGSTRHNIQKFQFINFPVFISYNVTYIRGA